MLQILIMPQVLFYIISINTKHAKHKITCVQRKKTRKNKKTKIPPGLTSQASTTKKKNQNTQKTVRNIPKLVLLSLIPQNSNQTSSISIQCTKPNH